MGTFTFLFCHSASTYPHKRMRILPPPLGSPYLFIHWSTTTHIILLILQITLRVKVANNQNSWGGKGAKKSKKNPKFLIKTAGIEPALRKDFTTSNVIITEKKDRKAAAFQVKDLPYPYTSVEQFEARFKTPLGSEWNSRAVHQKETMPRVVKKVRCVFSFLFRFSPLHFRPCPFPAGVLRLHALYYLVG